MKANMHRVKQLGQKLPRRRDWMLLILGALIALVGVGIVMLIERVQIPLRPEASGITSPWVPATVKYWQAPIDDMARKYDLDPNLIAIIMTLESGGYAAANSGEAVGLMQITPLTGKDIASQYLKQPVSSYNLSDPRTSIEFGAAYLSYLRSQFGNVAQGPSWNSTVELIAAGYNGGPGAAASLKAGNGLEDAQTVVYSRDAFNMWRERQASHSPTYDRWLERGGSTLIDAAKAAKQ